MNRFALGPRLLADVGGTNARFALELGPQHTEAVAVLPCAGHASLREAIGVYLAGCGHEPATIRHAAIAIANPIDGDAVSMTNHHWSFSIAALQRELDLDTLLVVNDFTALAMALPHLDASQRLQVGGGSGVAGRTIGLVGAGTGLGVSGIVPAADGRWVALASEGGHASFAPADEAEDAILRQLRRVHGHVSNERLLSGAGLEAIYHTLCGDVLGAADISARALAASCSDCTRSVDVFCAVLGGVAGDVALTLGATGGMYIGGGIVPRLGRLFAASPFRARFEAKGRLAGYLARIPTYVITEEYPAFLGVSAILAAHMATTEPTHWR